MMDAMKNTCHKVDDHSNPSGFGESVKHVTYPFNSVMIVELKMMTFDL
jgi:hypothetical protein